MIATPHWILATGLHKRIRDAENAFLVATLFECRSALFLALLGAVSSLEPLAFDTRNITTTQ
jgi:hypothetical protein